MDMTLSDELYARARELLLARLGLHYPERRRDDLARGLTAVARERGYPDLARLYIDMLSDGPLWDALVAQLTIGETYFFRNGAQFAALRERILPDLLARRAPARSLRLWSAGCATGEEPYSLAMTLAETLPASAGWQVSLLGTDLNPGFLERAREGIYGSWSFRETPDELRERYFVPEGQRWRLRPEIRRTVMFSRLNLALPGYPALANGTAAMDLIFCRNVLIYFDEATIRAVAGRLYDALAPGGWLVLGHAEPNASVFSRFEPVNAPGAVLYRKPANAPLFFAPAVALGDLLTGGQGDRRAGGQAGRGTGGQGDRGAGAAEIQTAAHRFERVPPSPPPPSERSERFPPSPPPAPPPDHLAAAHAAADRGDWAAARAQAERALAADPLCAPAHYILGQVCEHADDPDGALAAYRRSLYLDPGFALGALGMADILRGAGQRAEARRSYRVAQRILDQRPPDERLPWADGASAGELAAYARAQLALLDEV